MNKRHSPRANTQTGHIRIISGRWRGRKIPVLDAQGLRPTTDRTKETLFNWLMQDVQQSHCLDVFAGSGGLGLEALSRRAKHVTFLEKNDQAARQLQQNLKTLATDASQAKVIQGDSLNWLSKLTNDFDIIFIDPPFAQGLVAPSVEKIINNNVLKANGLVYIEAELGCADFMQLPSYWELLRQKQTKQLDYRLYRSNDSDDG